ncbi:YceK/YidQ family lipoprotein [Rheinheimera sp. 1928-s]|uniref:YceK/YidQ family lipoprotein n=1 Tax=Rheinheimera sp. 1928-s TaxID=3033803 RepID=UPI00262A04DF|nr:YceK/YidQ family lipoprotein [Rheinheimera sp. 1928-s]MDF3125023.1 YceK/YidQ family lipoprotein [Rheinheimera sp. 1928-s]
MRVPIKTLSLFTLLAVLTGCGTMQTLEPEKGKVAISFNDKKSYCQSIPRIYSGTAHNFCQLYGEPTQSGFSTAMYFSFWASDTVLCAVTDTLALPYTVTRQIQEGSLKVVH